MRSAAARPFAGDQIGEHVLGRSREERKVEEGVDVARAAPRTPMFVDELTNTFVAGTWEAEVSREVADTAPAFRDWLPWVVD